MIDTLCLGGGGIKALSYLGALDYLEEKSFELLGNTSKDSYNIILE